MRWYILRHIRIHISFILKSTCKVGLITSLILCVCVERRKGGWKVEKAEGVYTPPFWIQVWYHVHYSPKGRQNKHYIWHIYRNHARLNKHPIYLNRNQVNTLAEHTYWTSNQESKHQCIYTYFTDDQINNHPLCNWQLVQSTDASLIAVTME